MWNWPAAERYLSQIDSAAQPLTEVEPALVHVVTRGHGSSASWGIGGHSVIIVEYIKDGRRHLVSCDIQAELLGSLSDGLITEVRHREKSAPLKRDYGLHREFLPHSPLGVASWRVSFSRAESLLNNIKEDVVRTAKALANIFLALENQLEEQQVILYLQPYKDFFQLNKDKKNHLSSLVDPEKSWLILCEIVTNQTQYSPIISNFLQTCSMEISKSYSWIKHFITKLYKEEKTVIDGKKLLKESNLIPYRITGSGPVYSAWHSKPRENLDDPLNCCEWTQEHLSHENVKINLYARKSKPAALTASCIIL